MGMLSRRRLITTAAGVAGLSAISTSPIFLHRAQARILVVGGGPGGVAVARAVKSAAPDAHVVLVERDPTRLVRNQSRDFITGRREPGDYNQLVESGVDICLDEISSIDWNAGQAGAISGRNIGFDRLVMAPGIAFRDEGIAGYDEEAAELFPHGWTNRDGVAALAADIRAMAPGGQVIIRIPPGQMRYPTGPYRRAAEIAEYFEQNNPTARILLLDQSKPSPARYGLVAGLNTRFGKMIEHVPASAFGELTRLDVASRTLVGTKQSLSGDVINFIPAQSAGRIAQIAGLSDSSGWCPSVSGTGQSLARANTYLIGEMPSDLTGAVVPGISRAASCIASHLATTI